MSMLLTALLCLAIVLGPAVYLFFLLPQGRACPGCGEETVLLQAPLLRPLRRLLSLRWCLRCGWDGLVRQRVWRDVLPGVEVIPEAPDRPRPGVAWRRPPEDSRE